MLVDKPCTQCGNRFEIRRRDQKFCSVACKQREYRQRQKGESLRRYGNKERQQALF